MFHKNDLFHTSIGFDMRVPDFGAPPLVVYEEALKMIEYADRSGIEEVHFQEHHQSEDGYCPVPFLIGTAAAARTQQIAVVMGAVILPFHDRLVVICCVLEKEARRQCLRLRIARRSDKSG